MTLTPASMAIHDQTSYIAYCLSGLALANKMVPLTMASVPFDAPTFLTASNDHESCDTLFQLISSNEQIMPLMMQLASCGNNGATNGST